MAIGQSQVTWGSLHLFKFVHYAPSSARPPPNRKAKHACHTLNYRCFKIRSLCDKRCQYPTQQPTKRYILSFQDDLHWIKLRKKRPLTVNVWKVKCCNYVKIFASAKGSVKLISVLYMIDMLIVSTVYCTMYSVVCVPWGKSLKLAKFLNIFLN